jgi:hypothetical protein
LNAAARSAAATRRMVVVAPRFRTTGRRSGGGCGLGDLDSLCELEWVAMRLARVGAPNSQSASARNGPWRACPSRPLRERRRVGGLHRSFRVIRRSSPPFAGPARHGKSHCLALRTGATCGQRGPRMRWRCTGRCCGARSSAYGGAARTQRNSQGRGAWVCCSRCGVVESDASPVYMLECRHSTVCVGCGQNMVKVRPCQQQRPCVGCGGGEVERTAVRHPRAPGAHTRRSRLSFLGDPGPGCRVGFGRQRRLVAPAACK